MTKTQLTACDLVGWEAFSESGYQSLQSIIDPYSVFLDPFVQIAANGFCYFVHIRHDYYSPGIFSSVRRGNREQILEAAKLIGATRQAWTSCHDLRGMRVAYCFRQQDDAVKFALLLPEEARQLGVD